MLANWFFFWNWAGVSASATASVSLALAGGKPDTIPGPPVEPAFDYQKFWQIREEHLARLKEQYNPKPALQPVIEAEPKVARLIQKRNLAIEELGISSNARQLNDVLQRVNELSTRIEDHKQQYEGDVLLVLLLDA